MAPTATTGSKGRQRFGRVRRVVRWRQERTGRRPRPVVGLAGVAVAVAAVVATACGSTLNSGAGSGVPSSGPTSAQAPSPSGRSGTAPATAPAAPAAAAATADWTTYDRTASRSGVSPSTPAFTPSSRLVRTWTGHVDGAVYAQPLVVGREVIVATSNDSVYAFDSATGRTQWMRHLATPVPSGLPCGDILPSGITGTPVADVGAGRVWVVTFSPDPYRHILWSLDLTSGAVSSQRRVDGPGSDARAEQERGALNLVDGRVLIPYGGLDGDCSDYHGWVVGAPVSGRGRLATYVTPTERQAGIWAPGGPVVGDDSVYVSTGNGTPFDVVDDSDSVVRLSPTNLKVLGTFTPSNWVQLSAADQDLSSTAPVVLPDDLVWQIGKQGVGYVIGARHPGGIGGQLAERQICPGGFGGAVADGLTVVMSCYDGLYAVRITPATAGDRAGIRPIWSATGFGPGPPIMAGGVVWATTRGGQLLGYRLASGRRVADKGIAAVVTSFPSLSASGGRLFVPEGREVVSYRGV